jgi:hypothetical protein
MAVQEQRATQAETRPAKPEVKSRDELEFERLHRSPIPFRLGSNRPRDTRRGGTIDFDPLFN